MIETLEKHYDEVNNGNGWIYTCEYNINEVGDKINEIIKIINGAHNL